MFPVEKGFLVYGAVKSQSRHHRRLDTSLVQDLGGTHIAAALTEELTRKG